MENRRPKVDKDKEKIDMLNSGEIPIYEPGLDEIVRKNYLARRLKFTTDLKIAVRSSDIIFICVGSPTSKKNRSANLQFVFNVAREIRKHIKKFKIIVCKSTVPVTTGDKIEKIISKKVKKRLFEVISNPEFLREGDAIRDFKFPDRIVIGTNNKKILKKIEYLYEPLIKKGAKLFSTTRRGAEIIKYASNSFLATKISFINEIANLCEKVGADIESVRKIMSEDKRIGRHFIFPGLGYGGSCFPKDVKSLIDIGKQNSAKMELCSAVDNVNANQRINFFKKIEQSFGDLKNKKFALWGLSFKPNTDDIREAPSIDIARFLLGAGARLVAHDPVAVNNFSDLFSDSITFSDDNYSILKDCDALIINTEWSEYKQPDFNRIKNLLKSPVIFDGRNLYNKQKMKDIGFYYSNIGFQPQNEQF